MSIYNLSYEELLLSDEWREKRKHIINRDTMQCRMCGNQKKSELEVHHRYYVYNSSPWNYPDEALITLCQYCHSIIHDTYSPIIYAIQNDKYVRMNFTPCNRCGGRGYMKEYKNIQGGICFRCRGHRFEELIGNPNESIKELNFIDLKKDVFDLPLIQFDEEEKEKIFYKGKDFHFGAHGAPFDLSKAYTMYLIAAQNGFAKAQNNCGVILKEDYNRYYPAFIWFVYASMKGAFQAQHHLSKYFKEGIIVPKNELLSKKWEELSSLNRNRPNSTEEDDKLELTYYLANASDEGLRYFFKDSVKK